MADTQARIVIAASDQTGPAFNSARRSMAGLADAASGIGAKFVGIAGTIGIAAAAAAGLGAAFRNLVNGLDALNDLSDATGASVDNIAALEDVAARTGTSFETVSQTLIKFNQALAAAKPDTAQFEVFKRLGLDVEALKKADPVQALAQTAAAFSRFAADGSRARGEQELFGKALGKVAPLLKDLAENGDLGTKSLSALADEAEKFNKNLANIEKNSTDAKRALLGDFLPAINDVLVRFSALRDSFGSTGAGLLAALDDKKGFRNAADGIDYYKAKIADLVKQDKELPFRDGYLIKKFAAEREQAEKFLDFYTRVAAKTGQLGAGGGRGFVNPAMPEAPTFGDPKIQPKASKEAARSFDDYSQDITRSLAKMIEETDLVKVAKLNDQLKRLDELAAAGLDPKLVADVRQVLQPFSTEDLFPGPSQDVIDRYKALNDLLDQTPTAKLEKQRTLLQDLANAYERGRFGAVGSAEAMLKFGEAAQTALGGLPDQVEKLDKFAEQASRNIQDALGDTLTKVLDGDFKSIGALWANTVKRMVAEAAAAKLNKYLFGDNVFGGTGALGDIFGSIGSFLGIGKRAAGGPVSAGTPYLVGERGPELIVPSSAGTVVPNDALGGLTLVQHNTFGSNLSRAELAAGLARNKAETIAAVQQMLRRGQMGMA